MEISIRFMALAFICIIINIYLWINSYSVQKNLLVTQNNFEIRQDNLNEELMKKCNVFDYNFSSSEIQDIYKYTSYSSCKSRGNFQITTTYGTTKVKCKSNNPNYFSDTASQTYGGEKLTVKWSSDSKINSKSEFQLLKCSSNSYHANIHHKFNQTASENAEKTRKILKGKKKNMNVLLLVLDSVSRKSFQGNLPETYEFLKKFEKHEKNEFVFYEFERTVVPGTYTRANMAQILYGKTEKELQKNAKMKDGVEVVMETINKNQEFSIWNYYRKMGYVTMFLHDSVWNYLARFSGRVIDADHVFTNIWKYLWSVNRVHDFSEKQRCIGTRNFHDLSLEYTYQYFSNYEKNNKFAYVHLNAGHEQTGNIRTVDNDLLTFLIHFLKLIQDRNESLSLFLISDHGFKNTNKLQWDMRSFLDPRSAMTSVILTKDIVNEWETEKFMSFNKKQLNSRYDINLSLKEIAYFPYEKLENLKKLKNYQEYQAFSIFSEYLPENRTCKDVKISKEQCICKSFSDVDLKKEREQVIRDHFLLLLKKFLIENSKNTPNCNLFQKFGIIRYQKFVLVEESLGFDTFYLLEIRHFREIIKARANFCTGDKIRKTKKILDQNLFPYVFFKVQEIQVFLQISEVDASESCLSDFCEC